MLTHRAHLYAFVHPLFWPWLWFQLWRLEAWQRAAKRDVLFRIDRFGNLSINAIGDAPRDPRRYHCDAPPVPAWAAPGLASDIPEAFAQAALPTCDGAGLAGHVLSPAPHAEFSPMQPDGPRHAGRWCWRRCLEVHAIGNGAVHDQVRASRVGG